MKQTKITTNSHSRETGQTAIIMLMLMVVALLLGVTVSDRFIRSVRTITSADDSSKAVAVAESALERLLVLSSSTLDGFIQFNNCGSSCYLEITDTNGQKLSATVTLSRVGNSSDPYQMSIKEDDTNELVLSGYTSGQNLYVCWNGANSVEALYVYNQSNIIKATPFAYNSLTSEHPENNFLTSSAAYGYQNCFTVVASNTPLALRLKSVYGATDAFVVPSPGNNIPIQGIQLTSVGKAGSSRKTVTVIKSSPFLPSIFDYALYQKSTSDTLSN